MSGNLLSLQLSANADALASGTLVSSSAGTDGGGLAPWRDIATMTKYGVVDDQALALIAPNFAEQRIAARSINSNKITLGSVGSKVATVMRDPDTADKWRELDKIMVHDPEVAIDYLVARVVGYTFDEGEDKQMMTLDQFSINDQTIPLKRLQQAVFATTAKFKSR